MAGNPPSAEPPMTDETPLPCPWCGESPFVGSWFVECRNKSCVSHGKNVCITAPHSTTEQAVSRWNRRASPAPAEPEASDEPRENWYPTVVALRRSLLECGENRHVFDAGNTDRRCNCGFAAPLSRPAPEQEGK